MPADASRNVESPILSLQSWQESQGRPWHEPDFAGSRDDLRKYNSNVIMGMVT